MYEYVKLLKALADENRLRIMQALEIKPLYVCELSALLDLADSTVSKHLSLLREAGYVEDRKEGRWVKYQLPDQYESDQARTLAAIMLGWIKNDANFKLCYQKIENLDVASCRNDG